MLSQASNVQNAAFQFSTHLIHLPHTAIEALKPLVTEALKSGRVDEAIKLLGAQGVAVEHIPQALSLFAPPEAEQTLPDRISTLTPSYISTLLLGDRVTQLPYDSRIGILLDGAIARARMEGHIGTHESFKKPLSLGDVLANPDRYRTNPPKVVLIDVDGTTRRGQGWLDWIGRVTLNILTGESTLEEQTGAHKEILKIIIPTLKSRAAEAINGHVNREEVKKFIADTIRDMDPLKIGASLTHWHKVHGRKGISEFLCDEILRHYQEGHLVLLVSASPKQLIEDHARDLGLPPENVFGTTFTTDPRTNRLSGDMVYLHDSAKAEALTHLKGLFNERQLPFVTINAYTDSPSDLDMLQFALDHASPDRKNGVVVATNASKTQLLTWVTEHYGLIVHEVAGYRITRRPDPKHPGKFLVDRKQIDTPISLPTLPRRLSHLTADGVGLVAGIAGSRLLDQHHQHEQAFHLTPQDLKGAFVGFMTSLLLSVSPKSGLDDEPSWIKASRMAMPIVAAEITINSIQNPLAVAISLIIASFLPPTIVSAFLEVAYAKGYGLTGRVLRSSPGTAATRVSQLIAFQMLYQALSPALNYLSRHS